jgi:lactoylglutathione lyase
MKSLFLAASAIVLAQSFLTQPAAGESAVRLRIGAIDHIALTVSNVNASESFFSRQLGFELVRRDTEHAAVYMKNGPVVLTLYRIVELGTEVPFDRKHNVGLHHLAFEIGSFDELDSLHARLEQVPGVIIEFAPEPLGKGPAKHMIIREPGGNRIEFIHRPAS